MPTRKASATWEGGLKAGEGSFRGASGAIDAPYSYGTRFGSDPGTNPEELLAAAEAACFSMALAFALEKEGKPPTRIRTEAACTIEEKGGGYQITKMKLVTRGNVPGVDEGLFKRLALATKDGCPVSKALKGNLEFELDAALD
ncbi:OsmC family peroxiredoxin [Vulgatibacter incomptus]|uniref:Osmotically inducible protein C n=1 Tax=Vulgatibacter incomptus TaxID=1391653 RepID=A0A0K1P987_9BACT|nr:OsmC family peroxiredoxin [Vulgatibacter incomptus]AKU90072.1 Osmotically inducible protein C [Vulgatibacter incomptus]